jgi:hypothetical protein
MAKATVKADPFETAPFDTEPDQNDTGGDEAQADIDKVQGAGVKPNPLVVVPSSEGKVTTTLKGGIGFNAPWVVIHSADVADALNQLSDENLPALLEKAQKASKYFQMFGESKPAATPAGQPAAAAAGQGGNVKTCAHGQMVARSGVKNGKAWSGHFCPTPQGTPDQCKPSFDR